MNEVKVLDWHKGQGLLPAIIQHAETGEVLMLGYMNEESWQKTLADKNVTFFSRSKQRLWTKGETSGHTLVYQSHKVDCDKDTLLILALPQGPTCHLGTSSCFGDRTWHKQGFLGELQTIVTQRLQDQPPDSYTTKLFQEGLNRMVQKVGEEAIEVVIAAKNADHDELVNESADLVFHLMVMLTSQGIKLSDISERLRQRHLPVTSS